jgi:hypothetical protein
VNARGVSSLAGVIHAAMQTHSTAAGIAMAVDAAGLLMSPETAAEIERLRASATGAHRRIEEVLDYYAEAVATVARLEQKRVELERIANTERERVAELERHAAADVTVYRASHESIVIGHYTTAAAAREHCEAYVQREHPGAVLDWIADEDDELSPAELAEQVGDEESLTGYVVTPVSVAAAYDPDGDE